MKILITGGTGFLGERLVRALLKKGHKACVFSNERNSEIEKMGTVLIIGDIFDKKKIRKALSGVDVVYHLAAILDESNPLMYKVNVDGTRNVISACRNSGVKRIILPSSIGVLGYTEKPAVEDMPYNPSTEYEKSKAEAERLVIGSGVAYTIARITIICGPNSFWRQIFRAARKGYPIIGSGDNHWHLVYVDDAVNALVLMLKPKAKNRIYHIADDDPHTYREVYETIAEVSGCRKPEKHVPVFLVKCVALLHETKCRIIGKKPNVTKMRSSIERLIRERIVCIEKAKKELGYKPKYDLEKGMKKTYRCLKEK